MIEVVGLEQTSLWIFSQCPQVLQQKYGYMALILFAFALNSFMLFQLQQDTADGSANGSPARGAKTRDSHLAPGMNKYSTPKAAAEES
jgi:hypothetical protein